MWLRESAHALFLFVNIAIFSLRKNGVTFRIGKSTYYTDRGRQSRRQHSSPRKIRSKRKQLLTMTKWLLLENCVKHSKKSSGYLQRDLSSTGMIVTSSTIRRRHIKAGSLGRKSLKKQKNTWNWVQRIGKRFYFLMKLTLRL